MLRYLIRCQGESAATCAALSFMRGDAEEEDQEEEDEEEFIQNRTSAWFIQNRTSAWIPNEVGPAPCRATPA